MGLNDTFQKAAKTAQGIFGDVFSSVRVDMVGSAVYDPSSGVVSTGASSVITTMLFDTYKQHEIDGEKIEPTDVKATISQIVASTFTPHLKYRVHRVEANASVIYDILDINQDPAGALWELQLRASGRSSV